MLYMFVLVQSRKNLKTLVVYSRMISLKIKEQKITLLFRGNTL